MPTLKIPFNEPIRIGQYLEVNSTDSEGKPIKIGLAPPDTWPGKPKKRQPPPPRTAKEINEYFKALLQWGLSFTESVWSYFDVWLEFTDGGKFLCHAKVTEALVHVIEPDPDDPKGPHHVSAQLNQSKLTELLTKEQGQEEAVYWDDLHRIEVLRKFGEDGEVPDIKEDDSPEEKQRKRILKDVVDRIENQIFDVEIEITGKPR